MESRTPLKALFSPRSCSNGERVPGQRPTAPRKLRVALINPRFEPSYFGNDYALPLFPGKVRSQMAPGALPLLAAFVPSPHEVVIFDENVYHLDLQAIMTFDVVGVTGMIVQRQRMKEILQSLAGHRGIIAVGGPYASVDETFFSGLCDVLFVGEADQTWPQFITALLADGSFATRYQQDELTDLTTLPCPRYDLLDLKRYRMAAVQFSRGCPFLCEFCDIITIYGRKPRAKVPEQILQELDVLRAHGLSRCFVVDDNFIGNKKLARELLHRLIAWQEQLGFPFSFSTEASIDLADNPELLDLMQLANFDNVFIGIESPNADSLSETRKVQNLRGDSLQAKIERIRQKGLFIQAGFIVGFDSDTTDIFDLQYDFIRETQIAKSAVGILCAIPSTPLFDRLNKEGRLRLNDPHCNFSPKQMTVEELCRGFLELNRRLYEPEEYLGRSFASQASAEFKEKRALAAQRAGPRSQRHRLERLWILAIVIARLAVTLWREGELRQIGAAYWRSYLHRDRWGAVNVSISDFVSYCAQHWHYYKFFKETRRGNLHSMSSYSYVSEAPPLSISAKIARPQLGEGRRPFEVLDAPSNNP